MYISDIKEDWRDGKYSFFIDIPAKVKADHVFDENLSVKKNREMAMEHNKMVDDMQAECLSKRMALAKQLRDDVADYIVEYYRINQAQAEIIERYVYGRCGMCKEYFNCIDEIASLTEDILKA